MWSKSLKRRLVPLLFIFFATVSLFGNCVEEGLQKVSPENREKMESFFEYVIKLDHAGHVLYFDNKPISFIGISLESEVDSKFREGWYSFKAHQQYFPSKSYVFDERIKIFDTCKCIHIFLINKKAFRDCIHRHQKLFQEILGETIDGSQLLKEIEKGKHLMELIKENEILLGVLLGYGEESSRLYVKRQLESNTYDTNDDKYVTITSELTDGIEIFPVAFIGSKDSEEAQKINCKFQEEWKTLWEVYQQKNQDSTRFFLEALCR
jgi:hypothetical protein